jgi:hypothetical protein
LTNPASKTIERLPKLGRDKDRAGQGKPIDVIATDIRYQSEKSNAVLFRETSTGLAQQHCTRHPRNICMGAMGCGTL